MSASLTTMLAGMPKAELHMHIEGSLEPELIFQLAARNGMTLPFRTIEALRNAYAFTDLQSFLDIYYAGASVLQTQRDFYDMTMAYLQRARQDNVVHAEIFFDPQTHTARGLAFSTVIDGIRAAIVDARKEWGMSASIIMCFLRHLTEDEAFVTLAQAMPHRAALVGVGLDSAEVGNPPEKFARVFARCRELGLRVVAHAGEEGPAQYIRTAIEVLKVERIDHGVRCLDDPQLTAELVQSQMPLTVCPLSNIKLRVFDRMEDHNLCALLDAGVCATVNSDDPAYFGGYMNANLTALAQALPLERRHAEMLARNSFRASFLSLAEKERFLAGVDLYFKGI